MNPRGDKKSTKNTSHQNSSDCLLYYCIVAMKRNSSSTITPVYSVVQSHYPPDVSRLESIASPIASRTHLKSPIFAPKRHKKKKTHEHKQKRHSRTPPRRRQTTIPVNSKQQATPDIYRQLCKASCRLKVANFLVKSFEKLCIVLT